jgi:hypothetical protein
MTFPDTEPPASPGLDADELEHLLTRVQDGVVSRRQLRELGARDHDIVRLVRRRDLVAMHPGVYVNYTGPLSWVQRAWVAVLACWPAALSHRSALPAPPDSGPIHVAIDHRRSVRPPARVVVHRIADFDQRTNWRLSPPRLKLEHAAIDVALGKDSVADRFRVFADACQTRETTAGAIVEALATRDRVPDRSLLVELLEDLEKGACSVLEREYRDLERRHGLPDASRQRPDQLAGRTVYRDAPYIDLGVRVELDGRAFHDNAGARDRDAERDLDTLVADESITVRLTYGQVFDRGCETVAKVAALLERRGWPGAFVRCPDCP